MSRRTGISLLEVMVAVTVLGIGLLSLAAANAAFARHARGAAWEAMAAAHAHDRLERLAASCAAGSGVRRSWAHVERWRARRAGAVLDATVTVAAPPGAAPRTRHFEARLWCADR
ncbi:MAG TPA: prepilin-type N-terminal cleavage/methylation domain-containing protein [Gemmatimonadaceae bacterium]|nr:prepilin-type N-terminal cleavage/methylation domain-containing protein [Gemmatimonadaceae bacterium]